MIRRSAILRETDPPSLKVLVRVETRACPATSRQVRSSPNNGFDPLAATAKLTLTDCSYVPAGLSGGEDGEPVDAALLASPLDAARETLASPSRSLHPPERVEPEIALWRLSQSMSGPKTIGRTDQEIAVGVWDEKGPRFRARLTIAMEGRLALLGEHLQAIVASLP